MIFLETSSLNGTNVQEAFHGVTKDVIDKQNVQLKKIGGNNNESSNSGGKGLRSKDFNKE